MPTSTVQMGENGFHAFEPKFVKIASEQTPVDPLGWTTRTHRYPAAILEPASRQMRVTRE